MHIRSLLSVHVLSNFNMAAKNNQNELRLESSKGAKSPFWAHFGFEIDESGKRVDEKSVRCRLCNHKVGFSGNTTNLNVNKMWVVLLLN